MRFVKAGIQKYIDLINEFAQKEGDEFNRSVYHQHIGDLNQAIKRIEDYDSYMDTPASIEDEAERFYPYPDKKPGTENIEERDKVELQQQAHITCACQYMGEIEKLRAENGKMRKALEMIRDGFDHENDAHKYQNLGACPVCIATSALK